MACLKFPPLMHKNEGDGRIQTQDCNIGSLENTEMGILNKRRILLQFGAVNWS
jgi:hypothetical protein